MKVCLKQVGSNVLVVRVAELLAIQLSSPVAALSTFGGLGDSLLQLAILYLHQSAGMFQNSGCFPYRDNIRMILIQRGPQIAVEQVLRAD